MQWSGDHVAAGAGEVGGVGGGDEVEAALAQECAETLCGSDTVGGDHHAVLIDQELFQPECQPFAVTHDRAPSGGLHHRGVRVGRCRADRPHLLTGGQQTFGVGVQPRERPVGVARPSAGERAGQVVFLGEQVVGPVAHPAGFEQHQLGVVGQHRGDQPVVVQEPWQPALHPVEQRALGQPLPVLAPPRLRRDQFVGAGPHLVAREELAGREDQCLGKICGAPLIVDGELGEAIDLVAPQVDADRCFGRGREHVDDGTTTSDFAAVLDELFAAVSVADERAQQFVGVEDVAGSDLDRVGRRGAGAQLL